MKLRVLITGSRKWESLADVFRLIETIAQIYNPSELTIIHGGCPTGADWYAHQWVGVAKTLMPYTIIEEAHPASWKEFGKAAGPIRNREMVKLGADICLAFIRNNSAGATMTAKFAEEAGIKVYIVKVNDKKKESDE